MRTLLIILTIFLSGCITGGIKSDQSEKPPEGYKEIRCTCINGKGRYGTLTQYVKGKAKYCKLTMYGEIEASDVTCENDKVTIKAKEIEPIIIRDERE